MFSSTFKRSAATVGVVAGLLAAAAPASAQILDGPVLAKAGPKAPLRVWHEAARANSSDPVVGTINDLLDELKAPANAVTASISAQSGLERIAAPDWDGSNKQSAYFLELSFDAKSAKEGLYFKAPGPTDGTQVGSEGVKAPTNAGTQIGIED